MLASRRDEYSNLVPACARRGDEKHRLEACMWRLSDKEPTWCGPDE